MAHPYVSQLRFARSELERCLEGTWPEDAVRRIKPMNCLSWIVGHLANQEHRYWVQWAQDKNIALGLDDLVGHSRPPSTPSWDEMWAACRRVTTSADDYLDNLQPGTLSVTLQPGDRPAQGVGRLILRNIYHYWFHLGEAHSMRQMLGHRDLPQFVGDLSTVDI